MLTAGGLSSYAISLLTEAWLEKTKPQKDYKGQLYLMFKDLLHFYAFDFDFRRQSIWLTVPPFMYAHDS